MTPTPVRTLTSAIAGVDWPAIPGATEARLTAVLFQLEQSQWWPADALIEHQYGQLGRVMNHAWQTVPFYRKRLENAGYRPGQPVDAEFFRTLPLLTRDDIQTAGDALKSTDVPKTHGRPRASSTSGSTGQAVRVLGTELNSFMWMAFTLREHFWHRRDFRRKLAAIRYAAPGVPVGAPPDGTTTDSWGPPVGLLYASGPAASLDISTDIDVQVAWLQRQRPDYLLTYPSNLHALAEHCLDHGIRFAELREVRTVSEIVPDALRALCMEALDVPVVDAYSANEAGYIAMQCPDCGQYHIQSENVICEVLNDAGEPCGPGESGRVVVTPLHNFAMPLLRYEIRDYAEVGDGGDCGRGLPTLKSILGRSRNMMILHGGRKRWPSLLTWSELAPIAQYQVIQHSLDHLEARLVTRRPLTAEDEARLTRALSEQFGVSYSVTYTYLESLRGHENGKFEVFVSRVS